MGYYKMFLAERGKDGFLSLPAVEIKPENAKSLSSGLAVRILQLLAEKPMYPIELANSLKVHEQKVYYHIRNLERAGVIRVVKQEGRQGAVAKYYGLEVRTTTEEASVWRRTGAASGI